MTAARRRLLLISGTLLAAGLALYLATPRGMTPRREPPAASADDNAPDPAAGRIPPAAPLAAGRPVDRRLAGGEAHGYRLALAAGDYLELVVEQRGIDVEVVLSDPAGGELLRIDSPNGRQGPETVMAEIAAAGEHRLTVSAYPPQPAGRYQVRLAARRPASGFDRRRAAAARAFARGEALRRRRQVDAAEAAYGEAAKGWRALADRRWQGETCDRLSRVYAARAEWRRVIEVRERASELFRETGQLRQEADNQDYLGRALLHLGEIERSLAARRESLALWQKVGDREYEAVAWNGLGIIHKRLGEVQRAIGYYGRALERWRELGDRRNEANVLSNLGSLELYLGRSDRALDRFREAEELWRGLDDPAGHAVALDLMGQVHLRLGDPAAARASLEQALELRQAAGDRRGRAVTLANLGLLHRQRGELEEALARYRPALAIFVELGDRPSQARVRQNLGWIHNAAGRPEAARETSARALASYRELKNPKGEADSWVQIAAAERRLGALEVARDALEQAFEIYETLRRQALGPELRAAYFATLQERHETYVDLLMELHRQAPRAGWDARALGASERGRARSLLEMLEQAAAGRRHGDPELVERQRAVQEALNVHERLRTGKLDDSTPAGEREVLDRRLRELADELAAVRARLRVDGGRSGSGALAAAPLDVRAIQRRVLDADTLLLEIELGSERSFLWRVSRDRVASFELPPREVIERAARTAYRFLTVSHRRESRTRTRQALCELGRLLLAPVAGELDGKRLLIAAEGALQVIPFAALPRVETADGADGCVDAPPLVAEHEIVQLPSASILAALRRRPAAATPPVGTVAVVADPVFAASDPRVRRPAAAPSGGDPPGRLPRLRNSRREAAAILAATSAEGSLQVLDFAANKQTVLSGALAGYRFVHFATHAVIDAEHPELSSLALSAVGEGGGRRDGRLYAHEIYDLDLAAELVVLSACRTALGKEIRGEGLIGLTQAFFSAGTRRLIVGLWNVDDRATAELMGHLYRGVLADGLPPAAALRRAQLALWRQEHWRAPYYWAGFVLQGDWR